MGGPLKLYDVVMHGVPTRMKLNEADAERYNATLVGEPESDPEQEDAPAEPSPAAKKRATSNKARTAANKDGGSGGGD